MLALPPLVAWLSPIALLLAALYPFFKRWIHIPQAMLGIAFGWGTIMAWAAVREQVDAAAWLLFGATAAWIRLATRPTWATISFMVRPASATSVA